MSPAPIFSKLLVKGVTYCLTTWQHILTARLYLPKLMERKQGWGTFRPVYGFILADSAV